MNKTLVIQVIMGQKINLRILDLRSLIDREESRLVSRYFIYSKIDASIETSVKVHFFSFSSLVSWCSLYVFNNITYLIY